MASLEKPFELINEIVIKIKINYLHGNLLKYKNKIN